MNNKDFLTNGDGWLVKERLIPETLIDNFVDRMHELHPVRALSRDKQYAEKDNIKDLKDISIWWSQTVMDWPEMQAIKAIIDEQVNPTLDLPTFYASDVVVIESQSNLTNPHVDTPHRFKQWNEDERLLGVQCIIALQDTTPEQGSTGFVPKSHIQDWDIDMCYSGAYNKYFYSLSEQRHMTKGSVLMYNCRLLHSSMPNYLPKSRPALLLNYLNGAIVEDVKKIDNIWQSNA
jgi:ectoine hydroxylase-related dioxygenase (phytanoyl-CoA dioxygenase family)